MFMPVDNTTDQHKGFAFVTFDDSSLASTLCSEGKIIIEGKEVKHSTCINDLSLEFLFSAVKCSLFCCQLNF